MKVSEEHIVLLKAVKRECSRHEESCEQCKFYENEGKTECILDNICECEIDCPCDWN